MCRSTLYQEAKYLGKMRGAVRTAPRNGAGRARLATRLPMLCCGRPHLLKVSAVPVVHTQQAQVLGHPALDQAPHPLSLVGVHDRLGGHLQEQEVVRSLVLKVCSWLRTT